MSGISKIVFRIRLTLISCSFCYLIIISGVSGYLIIGLVGYFAPHHHYCLVYPIPHPCHPSVSNHFNFFNH